MYVFFYILINKKRPSKDEHLLCSKRGDLNAIGDNKALYSLQISVYQITLKTQV